MKQLKKAGGLLCLPAWNLFDENMSTEYQRMAIYFQLAMLIAQKGSWPCASDATVVVEDNTSVLCCRKVPGMAMNTSVIISNMHKLERALNHFRPS